MDRAFARDISIVMEQTVQAIHALTSNIFTKTIASAGLLLLGRLFDVEIVDLLIAVCILVVIDFVTGTVASVKYEGVDFTSARAYDKPLRFFVYCLMIISSHQVEVLMGPARNFIPVTEISLAFIGITEFVSILENFERMGHQTPKRLLSLLRAKRDSL